MKVKDALRFGQSIDLPHAIAIAASSLLDEEYGVKRSKQIWNSQRPGDINKVHSALWRATFSFLRDSSVKIAVEIDGEKIGR